MAINNQDLVGLRTRSFFGTLLFEKTFPAMLEVGDYRKRLAQLSTGGITIILSIIAIPSLILYLNSVREKPGLPTYFGGIVVAVGITYTSYWLSVRGRAERANYITLSLFTLLAMLLPGFSDFGTGDLALITMLLSVASMTVLRRRDALLIFLALSVEHMIVLNLDFGQKIVFFLREFGFTGLALVYVNSVLVANARYTEDREKALQESVKRGQEAITANAAKSAFLSTMSHELRTPLNAILGYAGLIISGMATPDLFNDYIARIQEQGKALLEKINDLLDLSKIEATGIQLHLAQIDLRNRLDKSVQLLKSLADVRGIELQFSAAEDLPNSVATDWVRLDQIVTNLIGNAIRFTVHGGVYVSAFVEGNSWCLQVRDTGSGMPPDAKNYIFESFRQVEQGDSRSSGGTGLGLAIVKKIVDAFEGRIEVESTLGKGSTFTVIFPLIDLKVTPSLEA